MNIELFRLKLKDHKPSTLLLISFLIVITVGALLLCLPFAHNDSVNFLDCLFASVSATCVTGLLTITPLSDLTLFGKIVLLLMIQIGGLSLVSFIAIAFLLMKKKLTLNEKKILRDGLNKWDGNDVSGYLKRIVTYTFFIELIGFFVLLTQLYDGSAYSVFEALFLSISSFCNAGMDISKETSLLEYAGNPVINLTVAGLIILGGLGFIVFFDIDSNIREWFRKHYDYRTFLRKIKLHTRIVLFMTAFLSISAMILIFLFEYNESLAGLSFENKLLASFFNSVTLRTAGFYTIDYSKLSDVTKLIMCVYMLVGASPGGTGGGFKTTTLFLMFLTVRETLKKKRTLTVSKRQIREENFIKAAVIILLYILFLFVSLLILTFTESFDLLDLLFEVSSALGTVGLTIGITSSLTVTGKIVIMLLMFIGRVGPTTLMYSLNQEEKEENITYPETEIIVG